MEIKSVVKVMNFHALLRVNSAKEKVAKAKQYESYLENVIEEIVNNKKFKEEHISIEPNEKGVELNIYIGSDLGFCTSFNSDIIKLIKSDNKENEKIIVGKKIHINADNEVLFLEKEKYLKNEKLLYDQVLAGIMEHKYNKINVIYIHYENLNTQSVQKKEIYPISYKKTENNTKEEDFSVEGDLNYIIWNLICIYLITEIKIAEALSWASENVARENFTNASLKKIDEFEEEKKKNEIIQKREEEFKDIVELNNRHASKRKKEENK